MNAYRRLDPHFEAPNQIKASASRSRLHDSHSDRQRKEHAGRSPLRGARRQSLYGRCTPSSRPASTARRRRSRTCAKAERYLPDNIYDAMDNFRKAEWTTNYLRRRCEGPLCGSEAGLGRPLPAPAGHVRQRPRKCSSTTRYTTSPSGTCSRSLMEGADDSPHEIVSSFQVSSARVMLQAIVIYET